MYFSTMIKFRCTRKLLLLLPMLFVAFEPNNCAPFHYFGDSDMSADFLAESLLHLNGNKEMAVDLLGRITEYLSGNREPNDNNLKAVDTPPVPLDERKSATFELYRSLIQRAIGQLYKSSKSSSAQKSTSSTRSADNVSRFRRFTEMTTPPIQCCQKTTGHSYCSTAATTTKKVKKSCMTKKKFTTKRKSCTTKKKSTKKRKLCTIKKRKSSTSKNKRRSSSTTANNRCPFNDFGTSEHVKHEQNSSAGQPTSTNSHYSNNDINYYY